MSEPMRKVFFAIPSSHDAVKVDTMLNTIDTVLEGIINGFIFQFPRLAGINPISNARNYALALFLASDCDDLVFVDDDLSWERGALIRLLNHPVDFVLGVYPYRVDPTGFPVRWVEDREQLWADPKTGLLEIAGSGFGFARITRNCAQKMVDAYPLLAYPEKGAPDDKAWMLFQLNCIENGVVYSEDMIFAKRWRDIGGQVWCDPEITFMHIGNKGFVGNFGNWMRERAGLTWKPTQITHLSAA